MKKIFLLAVIGILASSMAGSARAAMTQNDSAINAALDRMSQGTDAPRWRSSLGEIEQTTAVLVEKNRQLTEDYRTLSSQLATLERDLTAQREQNKAREAAIAERRGLINTPASSGPQQQRLAQLGRQVGQARQDAVAAQARFKAVDSKLALRRLKVQELELEKKSLLMDRDARAVATLGTLKQSIAAMKEQVASQKGQIDFVSKKISDLKSVDRPFLKDAALLVSDNAKLKNDLAPVMARRAELLKQVDDAVEKKNKASVSPDLKRAQDLAAKKSALEARIAAAKVKKDSLTAEIDAHAVDAEALAKQIKDLEAENKAIEEAMGNVRENIAVLEYRMSTLTRYKNRNSNKN